MIKDENDQFVFSNQIFECCNKCEWPDFSLCSVADNPYWQCGSEAYECVFGCRDEDSVLEAVVSVSSMGLIRKKRDADIEYTDFNITNSEVRSCMRHVMFDRHFGPS